MDRQGIHEIIKQFDARQVRNEAEWVMCTCPLAPWTHSTRKDSRASFGISVHENAVSIFHCFTCAEKGSLLQLFTKLQKYSGDDYSDLCGELETGEELGPPLTARTIGQAREPRLGPPISDDYLLVFPSPLVVPEAMEYLESRGVDMDCCNRLQIRYDKSERRIMFPVFDTEERLYGFSGRAIDSHTEPRVKDYFGLSKRFLILGSHLVRQAQYIIVTEGLFDYAKLQGYGLPAVALLGTEVAHKADVLIDLNKPVYAFFDEDAAGQRAAEKFAKKLINHIPVMKVEYPYYRENSGEFQDPAMLDKETIELMIAEAELFSV